MAERKFPSWATDSTTLSNGDPNKADPGSTKQALGWIIERPLVQSMNWLSNLVGHYIKANNEVKLSDTLYEAEAGEIVTAQNTAAVATISLPASPIDGQWVVIGGEGRYSDFAVTVSGNGNDIMVAADQSCELDEDDIMYIFHWRGIEGMWKINKWAQRGISI